MDESPSIIPVYCVPGMSAKPNIFEYLKLPEDRYEIHWLSWIMPHKKEPLAHYAKRLCAHVHHDHVILIGVSLGGMVVQEMQAFISVRQIVLISTVKTKYELPAYMNFGRKTKLYKLMPTFLARYFRQLERLPLGKFIKSRLHLYNHYIDRDESDYLKWGIEQVLYWDREKPLPGLIHLHGDKDHIFPIKNIKDCQVVEGGNHLMIIFRFRWINQHLPQLLAQQEKV